MASVPVPRIGIPADVHEEVGPLKQAPAVLRAERVDRVVVLGDVFYHGRNAAETVDLLNAAGAVGVWGNHDMGLCVDPEPALPARFPDRVVDFARSPAPRLEVGGCLFCQGPAHWEADDPSACYMNEPPEKAVARAESFAATAVVERSRGNPRSGFAAEESPSSHDPARESHGKHD